VPMFAPAPLRFPRALPPVSVALTEGGGGAMLSESVGRDALPVLLVVTALGGGATTSVGPKIRPMRPLTKDPPVGEGGGGAIALLGSGVWLAARCRVSALMSVEGGGATVAGAGKLNLELRTLALSGAETGGGTTVGSIDCTGAVENWRPTAAGAGGTTLEVNAGAARKGSRLTFCAGAATDGSNAGATSGCSRETLAAGGTTAGASAGATRV